MIYYHKTNNPKIAFTGQPSGSGPVPLSYLPSLGPSIIAPARATIFISVGFLIY